MVSFKKAILSVFLSCAIVLIGLSVSYSKGNFQVDATYNYITPSQVKPNQAFLVACNTSYEDFVTKTGKFDLLAYTDYVMNVEHNYGRNVSPVFFNVWQNCLKDRNTVSGAIALGGLYSIGYVYNNIDKSILSKCRYLVVLMAVNNNACDMAITLDTKRGMLFYRNPVLGGKFCKEHMPNWKSNVKSFKQINLRL